MIHGLSYGLTDRLCKTIALMRIFQAVRIIKVIAKNIDLVFWQDSNAKLLIRVNKVLIEPEISESITIHAEYEEYLL